MAVESERRTVERRTIEPGIEVGIVAGITDLRLGGDAFIELVGTVKNISDKYVQYPDVDAWYIETEEGFLLRAYEIICGSGDAEADRIVPGKKVSYKIRFRSLEGTGSKTLNVFYNPVSFEESEPEATWMDLPLVRKY